MKNNSKEVVELYKKTSYLWGMYGDTAKCAEFLIKAAKEVIMIQMIVFISIIYIYIYIYIYSTLFLQVEDISTEESLELYNRGISEIFSVINILL